MQAFDLSGGLSLHALQRIEGTVPLMVLASLYAGSRPARGAGFRVFRPRRDSKVATAGGPTMVDLNDPFGSEQIHGCR